MNTIGRMRNVFGELQKEKIEDIKPIEASSEGQLVDANDKFLVVIFILNFSFSMFHPISEELELPYLIPPQMEDSEKARST